MIYLVWRVWDEPTAESSLVFCLALELHSDTPHPAKRHQRNLGALGWGGFWKFPHPVRGWGYCALQSEGKIKAVGRRLGASECLGCLFRFACWLSLPCVVFCGGLPRLVTRGPGPRATRQMPRCFSLRHASEPSLKTQLLSDTLPVLQVWEADF